MPNTREKKEKIEKWLRMRSGSIMKHLYVVSVK